MRVQAQDIVEALPLPALLIRRDERIETLNAPALKLLGAGLQGRHFITALRQPNLLDAIEACLRQGQSSDPQFLTNDERQDLTFQVSVRPVSLESGPAALVCFRDVTMEEQIGQMRRDFVANVSHELRTPLTAIIGFIETLTGPAQNDPAARERFLGIMQEQALRMNRLVGDLLSLSKVEADERVRPTDRVELSALIRSSLNGLEKMADDETVDLEMSLPDGKCHVAGDDDQLRQVVTNLTENAIKYSGAGCTVRVVLSAPSYQSSLRQQGVALTVSDTGAGIDPVHIPRLTERFYRVDNHRSREMGGTGLGLAIVKHIINRHRGRLRVESTPGEGTSFTVILPVA